MIGLRRAFGSVPVLGAALALGLPLGAAAAEAAGHGSPDPSFGRGGTVTAKLGTNGGVMEALAIQPDGKLLAAGQAAVGAGDAKAFVLARYETDGSLDPSFGRDGSVTMTISAWGAPALVMQADGKFVALPTSGNAPSGTLVRFNADGSPDPGFGNHGNARVPLDVRALVIQPEGKLVVAGGDAKGFALARLNPRGTLDRTFGTGGKVRTPAGPDGTSIIALAVQRDGKLTAVGERVDGNVLLRYTRNGKLDPSFGKGGKVNTGRDLMPRGAQGLAIQTDGKIVLVGGDTPPRGMRNMYALLRYNRNGTRDTSFGKGGEVLTAVGSGAFALTIQPNGKIVVVGEDRPPGTDTSGPGPIVRFNRNGTLDRSFGTAGKVTTEVLVRALMSQPDGKLVAGGASDGGFTLTRYLP